MAAEPSQPTLGLLRRILEDMPPKSGARGGTKDARVDHKTERVRIYQMDIPPQCLFCRALDSSDEHVVSEALGCKEKVAVGICQACNNEFGHSFEGKFVNGLALFRNFFQVANANGVVPSVELKGTIGSEGIRVIRTGDGKVIIHPQVLLDGESSIGHEKVFRVFQKGEERKIEKNLRSRHADLDWRQAEGTEGKLIIDVQSEFDGELLCSEEGNRTIAKYALNLLTHRCGYQFVCGRVRSLIKYVRGKPSTTRAGILPNGILLKSFPFEPPKHLFVLVCDSKTRTATIFVYLFCLFPYCVITEDREISLDVFWSAALDPYVGRFTPLFLDDPSLSALGPSLPAFPMPEFAFAKALSRMEIGTRRGASRAAKNAMAFIQSVVSGQPGLPHICYNCKKVLKGLAPVCPYCGHSPLP